MLSFSANYANAEQLDAATAIILEYLIPCSKQCVSVQVLGQYFKTLLWTSNAYYSEQQTISSKVV